MSASFSGISAILHDMFTGLTTDFPAVALIQANGTTLFVKSNSAADIGTLPAAASLCHRYLHLGPGDVAFTNDPYSSGTYLGAFTLTLGISLHPSAQTLDLLVASRFEFAPILPTGRKIDDEGVRVPPMPLAQTVQGRLQINQDLLTAISHHPLAPKGLSEQVHAQLALMESFAKRLRKIARDPGSPLRPDNFAAYLEDSSRLFEGFMNRLPLGTSQIQRRWPTGEQIKLQLKINEEHVLCDFAGSDASRDEVGTLALTDLVTFGACWAAIVSPFEIHLPMNSGTFQHLQVSAPTRTLLSASAPLATARGATEGVARVARLVVDALAQSQASFKLATAPEACGYYELKFADGRKLSLVLPGGSGASAAHNGADARSSWGSPNGAAANFEKHECDYPVRWLGAGVRKGSGGGGKHRGGHGATVSFELLEPAELRWQDVSLGVQAGGASGGKPGLAAALEVRPQGREKAESHNLPTGHLKLSAGDQVALLAGGGGGFGEAPGSDENS